MSDLHKIFIKIVMIMMTSLHFSAYSNGEEPQELDKLDSYDARTAHPNCVTISTIKNQSNCGSCWAVAVASVFSDRLCIHSKGAINHEMSAGQLLSCDKKGNGCWGGYPYWAWKYIEENGLVTGGAYGKEGCYPYPIKPRKIYWYWLFTLIPKCPDILQCQTTYKVKDISVLRNDEYEIRKEIFKNGPVTASMKTYLSYLFYTKGILSITAYRRY